MNIVKEIHKVPGKGFVNFTGGGFCFLDALMNQGGGSNTLLGSLIPYDTHETVDLLGFSPKNFSAFEVAEALGMRAFEDAIINLTTQDDAVPAFGLGFTASLAKGEDEREGRVHQFHIYGQNERGLWVSISWARANNQGAPMSRMRQDQFLSDVAILALYVLKVDHEFNIIRYLREECLYVDDILDYLKVDVQDINLPFHLRNLLRCGIPGFMRVGEGYLSTPAWPCDLRSILPGSFNPYHSGHDEMRRAMDHMTGYKTNLELSLDNASKPPVSWKSLKERLDSISSYFLSSPDGDPIPVIITRAPLFVNKMSIFPRVAWGMGYDTAVRFIDPKFCDLDEVKDTTSTRKARFIVFPRNGGDSFPENAPSWFQEKAVMVPGFNNPVSSTELRGVK